MNILLRKIRVKLAAGVCGLALLSLTACGAAQTTGVITNEQATAQASAEVSESSSGTVITASELSEEDMFSERDYDSSYEAAVDIVLVQDGTQAADGVEVSDNMITITKAGTYHITGTLSDGQVVVDVGEEEKVQLVLDNASITCSGSAAIYVSSADKVFITSTGENTLESVGQTDSETKVDGAIFAKSTITLNGTGTLHVSSEMGHGIVSKSTVKVTSGTYVIDAAKKGIKAKNSVRIADGTLQITSGDDGIHSKNDNNTAKGYVYISGGTITIQAGDDAVHAETALAITGGTIQVEQSCEGLEGQDILISGGDMEVTSSDDAINAAGDSNPALTITGGNIVLHPGGDGVDSNGTLTVSGGNLVIYGPERGGNGILDYETSAVITGGTIYGVGASGMNVNFEDGSTVGSIVYTLSSAQASGTTVKLTDASGNVIAEFTPDISYQAVMISSDQIQEGATYTLTAGTETAEITMDSLVYGGDPNIGEPGGMSNMPGDADGTRPQKSDMQSSDGQKPDMQSSDGQKPDMPSAGGQRPDMPSQDGTGGRPDMQSLDSSSQIQ